MHRVEVYLKASPLQPPRPVEIMKREVEGLLAAAGYSVTWKNLDSQPGVTDATLLVLELRGVCRTPSEFTVEPLRRGEALASTAMVNGEVLPFSFVACDKLTQFVAPEIGLAAQQQRDELYGRALGRVTAHELLHALTKDHGHDTAGVGKQSYTPGEVLARHFDFDPASIERLREVPVDIAAPGGEFALPDSGH